MATVGIDRLVRRRGLRFVLVGVVAAVVLAVQGVVSASASTVFNTTTTLTSNTTWTTAGSPYILNADVRVNYGVTLTIEPGVIVKLNGSFRSMVIWGTLSAAGSAGNPIVITSLKDDSVGGDDGGDGPTVGAPGDWYTIYFWAGDALSSMRHVDVRYAGYGSTYGSAPLTVYKAGTGMPNAGQPTTLTVEDSTFRYSAGSGIYVFEGNLVLRRSVVSDNGSDGVNLSLGGLTADQNTISNNGRKGVQILLTPDYQGAQSRLTRNTITQNAGTGVHLFFNPGLPLAKYPTGTGNNIYGNYTDQTGTYQMLIGAAPAGSGNPNPWSGNYWGPSAYWRVNPDACSGTSPFAPGYLADSAFPRYPSWAPPYGAVTDALYSAGSAICSSNTIPFGPFDHSWSPIDTSLPLGTIVGIVNKQTLGTPGSSAHGNAPQVGRAEPVNTATGNYTRSEQDLRLYGETGIPLVFTRTYNSADPSVGPLGPGWTHNLATGLQIASNGDVTVRDEGGALLGFVKQPDGSFVAAPGVLSTLTAVGGGHELKRTDQTKYVFDAQGRLISLIDRNSKGLALAYDGNGRLGQVTDAVGRAVTLAYNTSGLLSSVTLPGGRHVDYGYTTTANVTRLTSVTDARGQVWTYTYEAHGLLERVIDPNAHTVVRSVYGDDGRVTDQYDALDHHGTFAWDAATQTSTFTDARGKQWKDVYASNVLQKTIDPLGHEKRFEYDAAFNVTKTVDGNGNETAMSYDGNGNMLTRTAPAPLSYGETWTYTAKNDVATYTNGRGNTTTYGYDTAGNLTSVTYPDPDGGGPLLAPVVSMTRDPAGTGLLMSTTDPRSKQTTFSYDSQGNLASVTTSLGNQTTFGYDGSGRKTSMVEPRGNVVGGTPSQYTTTYTYDSNDHLTTLTTPLGHVTSWAFDPAGMLSSTTDANSHTTSYGYDASNHLTSVTAPDPDGAGALPAPVTSYGYDAVFNQTSRTDANSHTTTFEYDDANRITAAVTPLGKRWSYGYDAADNLTSLIDANGNATPTAGDGTTTLSYDQLQRLTGIDYSDTTPDVTFAYDADSNRTQMTDAGGTETRAYDALDRLTTLVRGADTFAYEYDAASNLTKRTYPGAVITTYTYDNDERLATTVANGGTTSNGYDAASNLTTVTLPSGNGHVATRVYDRSGRLTEVQNKKGSTVLSRFQLTLDPVGNPTQVVRTGTPGETRKYLYDNMDRLKEVCFQSAACSLGTSPFIRWTYDGVGNRLTEARPSVATTNYAYDNDDRLTTAGPTTHTYDDNGNQTAAGARTFTYDLANRLKTTTLSGTTTSYSYTGDGRRTQATTGAGAANTTNYQWDILNNVPQLAIERDGANALLRRYSYGTDRIAMSTPTASFYYHYDDLGSVMNLTNSTGAKQWTETYEPYGSIKTETKNNTSAPTNVIKFAGEQTDATGLYHLRARQYDTATGRFLSPDPLPATSGDPNPSSYLYALDQPTLLVDPSGLRWCWKACPATDAVSKHVVRPVNSFVVNYYPRNARELFELYSIVETGLATAVAAGGTAVAAVIVCPAATAAGGPVGAVACVQIVVTGATLTVASGAAVVKEARHYASTRRLTHNESGSTQFPNGQLSK